MCPEPPCVQNLGSENFSIATNVFPVKMKHFQMKVVRTLHNKCVFIIKITAILYHKNLGWMFQPS
uniref:Uncharacterized protein n=1 Tax=Microcebus murinus TaxID=30608 RepID=A0A8C5Y5X7_MICMU